MGKIIATVNEKGGVGKTTTVLNKAHYFSSIKKKRVLLIDLDPQNNLTDKFFRGENAPEKTEKPATISRKIGESNSLCLFDDDFYGVPHEITDNLHIFGSSAHISTANNCTNQEVINFAENVRQLAEQYDYVFIDTPPSVGNLQFAALTASTGIVILVTAEDDAVKGVKKVMNSVSKVRANGNADLRVFGIALNLVFKRPTRIQTFYTENLRQDYSSLVLTAEIRQSTKAKEASSLQMSLFEYDDSAANDIQLTDFMNELDTRFQEAV